MSDLQCPARLFLLSGSGPPPASVVSALHGQRVVVVYGPPAAGELVSWLADELGAAVSTGHPGASFDDLADRHRGEAVVVVGDHDHDAPLVLVEIDADGSRTVPQP